VAKSRQIRSGQMVPNIFCISQQPLLSHRRGLGTKGVGVSFFTVRAVFGRVGRNCASIYEAAAIRLYLAAFARKLARYLLWH